MNFTQLPTFFYNDLNFTNPEIPGKISSHDNNTGARFNNVVFAGESVINSSNQFNTLTLGVGKDSQLMGRSTQIVSQLLNSSSCRSWVFDNMDASLKAIIKTDSDISLSHVRLSGIEVIGEADYSASGLDMGNNSEWTFITPKSQDLYWIGGSGNWTDSTHWTTNSDGSPSGGCVPTRFDNVFFTNHSGKSPTIISDGIAEFHDMTWKNVSGEPSIIAMLNCYGSMTLQPPLFHQGGVNFLSSDDQSFINTNGAVLANNFDVNFSGTGTYILRDDLTTNSRIYFTNGTLNTNDKTITALSFDGHESDAEKDKYLSLNLGSSQIFLSDADGWSYSGKQLNAGNSHINLIGSAANFKGNDGSVYHYISFKGNGVIHQILGSLTVDNLSFAARNTTYLLEAQKHLTVLSKLQMSGNNCSIVNIGSTVSGTKANLCLQRGNTSFNFISLRDINASCLPFTILSQSTDKGNNEHISFITRQDLGIGILGPDSTICSAQLPIILNGSAFMPNENSYIQWRNTSTGETLGNEVTQTITKAGKYEIKVVYNESCEVTDEIVITVDPVVDIADHLTIQQPTCSIPFGTITIKPENGILYSVDGGKYQELNHYEVFSGKHFITAKNSAGCVSDTTWVIIIPQPIMQAATISYGTGEFQTKGNTSVILNGPSGGKYEAFPSGLAIDTVSGTIDLENSKPDQIYTVTYTYNEGDCTGLCRTTIKINSTLTTISYPLMDYCTIGVVKILLQGAENGRYTSTPVGLSLDSLSGKVNLSVSNQGVYVVTYTYQDGTQTNHTSTIIKINSLPIPEIKSNPGTEISKGQSLTLTATGGVQYSWIGSNIESRQNTSAIQVKPTETTIYIVIVTNAKGCSNSTDFKVLVNDDITLHPNNVITPNADGKDDTWVIENIQHYPDNIVMIHDRAGRLIYSKKGYNNEWDGMLNGKQLNEDAYIFVIQPGNGKGFIRGTLSIIRDSQ